jgi:uncharacterized protein with von Willebrand factor type A (vWA) domain
MEHMLHHGSMEDLTEEELARAVRLDPSLFPSLGPSLESIAAMLRERKRRILATYETDSARGAASGAYEEAAAQAQPPGQFRDAFIKAVAAEQIADLERLWYKQKNEQSDFARVLMRTLHRLEEKYQVDELSARYDFTGRQPLTVDEALAVKEELETIDKLLEQLKEVAKDAVIGIIDMEALSEYADPGEIEALNALQEQIRDYLRHAAAEQGVEQAKQGLRITPHAQRLFQRRLLSEIFADLSASRTGRHTGPVSGEGPVEQQRTRPYEFGDAATGIDTVQTLLNAAARTAPGERPRPDQRDISIHLTRNTPRCATAVLMDMSGSMRYNAQYVNCKRMALALDGLIRTEFPGDFLAFVEMYTLAKLRPAAEVPTLLPRPVSIYDPVVRLRADMSKPELTEMHLPQHFTNIQHALSLARLVLRTQPTPNRQVILITDGLPTAHFEGPNLFMLYPPHQRTEDATMREAAMCAREGITINIFLLPSWSQSSEDVQFAHRMAMATRGRVFFTGGKDLDRFVLWDYLNQRRSIIA